MRIPCTFCGPRDVSEFSYRGDAAPKRPGAGAPVETTYDYVYTRANLKGLIAEHWYHASGCRSWLVVERDTRSHVITAARLATESEP